MDIYCWLAQRLHRVPATGQRISWQALHAQFGGQGYARVRDFRAFFLRQLRQVQAAYPGARLEEGAAGLVLRTSPPPVPKRIGLVGGASRPVIHV